MRYAAFISYSNADRALGEGLQKALEAYVVPASLRGQDFGHGALGKRIGPVFRDRWDAHASADLGATLEQALAASQALVVLCSPRSAASHWVGQEIRSFKRAGRDDRVLPVLIDGLPKRHQPQTEPLGAFHPALFEVWDGTSGQWRDGGGREPLAPDVRVEGDGLRFTVLKLVAALTGVPLTTLAQRQAEAERRERNVARAIAAVMASLAVGASVAAWSSWRSSVLARERLEGAVEMAARRVDAAAGFRDRYGVPSGVIRELLDGAREDFHGLTVDVPDTPSLRLQMARMDRLFSGLYEAAGEGAQQRAMAERSVAALARVPTQRSWRVPSTWLANLPAAEKVQTEQLLAAAALAGAQAAHGDAAQAAAAIDRLIAQAEALRRERNQPTLRSIAAQGHSMRARLHYEAGDLAAAASGWQRAEAVLDGASEPQLVDELAQVRSEHAETLLELGRHDDALALQEVVVIALAPAAGPSSPERRRAHAVAVARRGDMRLAAQRDLAGAKTDYEAAHRLLAELLAEDAARTDFKRDLSLTLERTGDALFQAGDLNAAAAAFDRCLALRRELVARDRGNVAWRRDLSVALERIGDIRGATGQAQQAEQAFAEALRLREAAFDAARDDLVGRRDLGVLWMRLGQARLQAGAAQTTVEAAYAKAIELLTPLLEHAAADSRWHRDLAVAYAERGAARQRAGLLPAAEQDLRQSLQKIVALRQAAPSDRQLEQDEAWLRARLRR